MQLVLNSYGLHLSQRNKCFQIELNSACRLISPARVSSILVTKSITVSSSALLLANENNIPVIFLDGTGQPLIRIAGVMSTGHSQLRKQQFEFSKNVDSINCVIEMLMGKTEGQLSNIAWWFNRKPGLSEVCRGAKDQLVAASKGLADLNVKHGNKNFVLKFLRGWEGSNARCYWNVFSQLVQSEGWNMKGREYRPATDPVNAMINYAYGMLYHQVESALACAGLDSQIGMWHRDNYQTPSLAFDLIEPFRPKMDRLLADLFINNQLDPACFETSDKYGYVLSKRGKELLIPLFNGWLEERTKMHNRVMAFKNHILQAAYGLKSRIEKIKLDE